MWALVNFIIAGRKKNSIIEPVAVAEGKNFYLFNKIPHWDDYFDGLLPYRDYLKTELFNLMKPCIRKKIMSLQPPEVGIHIRMGDFKKIENESEFKNVGATRTPLSYFTYVIQQLKIKLGPETHFIVFSDGHKQELIEILSIPNVALAPSNSDIVDLWSLSMSKVIVTSAGSTFSYWAAFLSDAVIIYHENFIVQFFDSKRKYQGPIQRFIVELDST